MSRRSTQGLLTAIMSTIVALSSGRNAAAEPDESRAQCAALLATAHHDEVVTACRRAVAEGGTPRDFRMLVAALLVGPELPTPEELAQASMLAKGARTAKRLEPWGYAAQCDIALRLGDLEMLRGCTRDLERVAPGHDETRRARRLLDAEHPALGAIVFWCGLLVASVVTLAHALVRTWARRRTPASLALGASLLLLLASPTTAAAAVADAAPPRGGMSLWPVDDLAPERAVPSRAQREANPLELGYWLMDVATKGDAALTRGEPQQAARYYEAMALVVPDRAVVYTKLCAAYEAAGDLEHALASCRAALGRPGVTEADATRFVRLLLATRAKLDAPELDDVDTIVANLSREAIVSAAPFEAACDVALSVGDRGRLEACVRTLAEHAPASPRLVVARRAIAARVAFSWATRTVFALVAGAVGMLLVVRVRARSRRRGRSLARSGAVR